MQQIAGQDDSGVFRRPSPPKPASALTARKNAGQHSGDSYTRSRRGVPNGQYYGTPLLPQNATTRAVQPQTHSHGLSPSRPHSVRAASAA